MVRQKLSAAAEACTFPPWPLSVVRSHPRFVLTLGQRCVATNNRLYTTATRPHHPSAQVWSGPACAA